MAGMTGPERVYKQNHHIIVSDVCNSGPARRFVIDMFKSRSRLKAENAFLHHQLVQLPMDLGLDIEIRKAACLLTGLVNRGTAAAQRRSSPRRPTGLFRSGGHA